MNKSQSGRVAPASQDAQRRTPTFSEMVAAQCPECPRGRLVYRDHKMFCDKCEHIEDAK